MDSASFSEKLQNIRWSQATDVVCVLSCLTTGLLLSDILCLGHTSLPLSSLPSRTLVTYPTSSEKSEFYHHKLLVKTSSFLPSCTTLNRLHVLCGTLWFSSFFFCLFSPMARWRLCCVSYEAAMEAFVGSAVSPLDPRSPAVNSKCVPVCSHLCSNPCRHEKHKPPLIQWGNEGQAAGVGHVWPRSIALCVRR